MISSYQMRRMADMLAKFVQYGGDAYLRVQSKAAQDDATKEYRQYGFTQPAADIPPTQDIKIDPPPQVAALSLHDIGISGGQLAFGDKQFLISHTWVLARQIEMKYKIGENPDFDRVFFDETVMGLFYGNLLYKIVSAVHEDFGGQPWLWTIIASSITRPGVTT